MSYWNWRCLSCQKTNLFGKRERQECSLNIFGRAIHFPQVMPRRDRARQVR
jgi:hypothetical protein